MVYLSYLDGRPCIYSCPSTAKTEIPTRRSTEWRPDGAPRQFGSRWRAAIGELIVRPHSHLLVYALFLPSRQRSHRDLQGVRQGSVSRMCDYSAAGFGV